MKKPKKKPNNIVICLPHNYPSFDRQFLFSLFKMQQHFYDEWVIRQGNMHDTLGLLVQGGYQLDQMRNDVVDTALAMKQTHIVFLDGDMEFPKETLVMMIEDLVDNEDQGIEMITGLYTYKKPPHLPQVYPRYDKKKKVFKVSGVFPRDQLIQVEGAPGGCCMIKAEVFKRASRPYYKFVERDKKTKKVDLENVSVEIPFGMGEDLYFCLNAKPKILLDPRISCKHFSYNGYGIDDYIKYNKLKIIDKKGNFSATPEQLKRMSDEHENKKPGNMVNK